MTVPAPRHLDMPTLLIPNGCICTWVVVSPAVATRCVSRLKYRNRACPYRHEPLPPDRTEPS